MTLSTVFNHTEGFVLVKNGPGVVVATIAAEVCLKFLPIVGGVGAFDFREVFRRKTPDVFQFLVVPKENQIRQLFSHVPFVGRIN